jgi:hypothetical protein
MLETLTNRSDSFVDEVPFASEEYIALQRKRLEQLVQCQYEEIDDLCDGPEDEWEDYCNYRMNNKG